MNLNRVIMVLFLMSHIGLSNVHADIVEGKDYTVLSNPQPTNDPEKIEILNFFWYGCTYCNQLQPYINTWLEDKSNDVHFQDIPAILHMSWIPAAKIFLTINEINAMDELHNQIYHAIHQKETNLHDESTLFNWIETQGINRDRFVNAFQSLSLQLQIARSTQMTRQYQLTGVPAIVVDGKYLTSTKMGGTAENTIAILNKLIEKVRQEKATKHQ